MLSFRAAARNLERLLMRPKPRIPRVARNDKVALNSYLKTIIPSRKFTKLYLGSSA
jgi:hypothetical protein